MTVARTARSAALGSVLGAVAARYLLDSAVGRTFDLEVFAEYALLMTLGALVGAIAPLGLPEVGNRVVAQLVRRQRGGALRSYLQLSWLLAVVLGVPLGLLAGLGVRLSSGVTTMLVFSLCLVGPSIALLNVRRAQALQLDGGNVVLFAPALSTLISFLAVALVALSGSSGTLLHVALYVALGNAVVSLVVCRTPIGQQVGNGGRARAVEQFSWVRQGLHAVSNAVASLLLTQGDIILIGVFVGAREAGAYAAASRLALVVTMALGGLIPREAPILGRLVAANDLDGAWRHFKQASRLSGGVGVLLCLCLVVGGTLLLELFVPGAGIAAGWLSILAVGRLGSALVGPAAELLIALNRQRVAATSSWAGAVLAIVLMIALGAQIGAVGVAIGATTGMLVRSFLHRFFARKYCRPAQLDNRTKGSET